MSRKYLGGDCFDELYWRLTTIDSDIADSGVALAHSASPGLQFADEESRGGINFSAGDEHKLNSGAFAARTGGWNIITYEWLAEMGGFGAGTVGWTGGVFYSDKDCEDSAVGACAIFIETRPAAPASIWVHLMQKTIAGSPGTWTDKGSAAAYLVDMTGYARFTLQVDTTGGSQQARILLGGVEKVAWKSLGTAAVADPTPSFAVNHTLGKNHADLIVNLAEYIVHEEDTATTGLGAGGIHIFGYKARLDGAGVWAAVGNAAGDCVNELRRAIDDVYDNDPQANDYISNTWSSGNEDQLFLVDILPASVVSVLGVAVCVVTTGPADGCNQLLIKKITGGVTDAQTPTGGFANSPNGSTLYHYFQVSPNGAGWNSGTNPEDVINDCQFGVRMTDGVTNGKVYGLIVMVIGDTLLQPSYAEACPAAGAQRRRGVVV